MCRTLVIAIILAYMPFTGKVSLIASFSQYFGYGQRFLIEIALISGQSEIDIEISHARLGGVLSGKQGGTGGGTDGVVVELPETNSFRSQPV
ncbi:hypothetical protein Barb7_02463 [Bacteroidales bacterium Barb7]|nr:hypothetical protein Barb7_02463 [Bacteroidales bacterium Barb7]